MSEGARKSVAERLLEASKKIGAMEKTGKADARMGGFKYHTIDDVLDHVRPVFAEVGIAMGVTMDHLNTKVLQREGKSPMIFTEVMVEVSFRTEHPEDMLYMSCLAHGMDTSDKGPGKAMAYGVKTILINALMLRGQPDNEQENHDLRGVRTADSGGDSW